MIQYIYQNYMCLKKQTIQKLSPQIITKAVNFLSKVRKALKHKTLNH